MKKLILVVLMVAMVTTPCFAQEVEPEGIFSIEGTEWEALPMGVQILPFPSLVSLNWVFGFYNGAVYPWIYQSSFYIDMLVCSVFWVEIRPGSNTGPTVWYYGILQPIGIGMVVERSSTISIGFLIKTDDNWKPPEFVSIFPNQGKQGTTLTDVTITAVNTDFESGVNAVMFSPIIHPVGEVISNIRTVSKTEIKFDLSLPTDDPAGFRDVIVIWDNEKRTLFGDRVFEVLPKTN